MITTYSDGGARGNPGPAAIGIIVYKGGGLLERYKKFIGNSTNNRAEYNAVIKALQIASKYGKKVRCYLDSQLVVRQLNGGYKVKNEELIELYNKVKNIEKRFDNIEYKHVRREDRGIMKADKLVNDVLDQNT